MKRRTVVVLFGLLLAAILASDVHARGNIYSAKAIKALEALINNSGDIGATTNSTGGLVVPTKLVRTVQTVTVADDGEGTAAAATLTPTGSYIEITCSDANGCDFTMSETGALEGHEIIIVNVGTNAANFADSAGVSELAGAFASGAVDSIRMVYTGTTWVELGRSNN